MPLAYGGLGRELLVALKFRRLLPLAVIAAELIAAELAPAGVPPTIVPVPPSPHRRLQRGFDPAAAIAAELARVTGAPLAEALRRRDRRRQRGRGRSARLAAPPVIVAAGALSGPAVVVDDVVTTGATLETCARAALEAGASTVDAAALALVAPPGCASRAGA